MCIIFFIGFIRAFIYNDPYKVYDQFVLPQFTHILFDEPNGISLYWENEKYINYSDKLHKTYFDQTTNGLCGPVYTEFVTNTSYMIGNITYYSQCNMSHDMYWNWPSKSICNTTNKICLPIHIHDIFHIRKDSFRVFDIEDTLLIYEQIAYIQPEIWFIGIILLFLCCFGIHSYSIAGSKIVT